MKKFFKLLGSFAVGMVVSGGTAYVQSGLNPIAGIISGVVGGITAAGFYATKSPLTKTFDNTTNTITQVTKPDGTSGIQVSPK